jgi:hypothetical protein
MLGARTAPREVPRVLKAGYNRWNAMGASVVATDDETSAFEIGMTRRGVSAGETAESVDQVAVPRAAAERRR